MSATVVITTFNRASVVANAIDSVLSQPGFADGCEALVIDDASSDGSDLLLLHRFAKQLEQGQLRFIRNPCNLGVTGSKNVGFRLARNPWVIFLDSDDELLPGVWPSLSASLAEHGDVPVVFFRCLDQDGDFVGRPFDCDQVMDLGRYLEHISYGEALTAVNKELVVDEPYQQSLRGYEWLGCCRMIASKGPAVLSSVIARRYNQTGVDRLSTTAGMMRRMPLLAKGHLMLIFEFRHEMRLIKQFSYVLKALVYFIIGYSYRVYVRVTG